MILVSAYHSAGVILCHCMDQGPGGWDQAESEARGLMQMCFTKSCLDESPWFALFEFSPI